MNETSILQEIRLGLSRAPEVRVFRNQTGALQDADGRLVTFGLCKGSSDLIGWKSIVITPEMIGQRVAVFTAVEVKAPGRKATPEQTNFLERVKEHGGLAGIARSVQDALTITNQL
jgi:hypothetical protein